MPAKNIVKQYEANGYYHIYNRGVEKRQIFCDEADYYKFLRCIEEVLIDLQYSHSDRLQMIEIKAFCLMPNHFHILIRQLDERAMVSFMRRVATKYVMYFNWKYGRVGSLFQGCYKAVKVVSDDQLNHVANYIHDNARALGVDPSEYRFSSKRYYSGELSLPWLRP